MKQEYELGNKFREIYGKFTGITYHPLEIRVNAGADNRTLVSAQLSMASFLPPTSGHIWNKNLLWNPIPIFANEIIDDVLYSFYF
jgi:hypothetical protein